MNLKAVIVSLMIATGLFHGFKILYHDGMVGQTKKALRSPVFVVKGCFCHGDTPSLPARVWIAGPETLAAGRQALYSIKVAKDSCIGAGFNVAAFLGSIGIQDTAGTQLMRVDPNNPIDSLELTQTSVKLAHGSDTISWSFWYRAPGTIGVVDTIYACGNAVDTSYDPSGDYWNFAPNFLVRIVNPTNVVENLVAQTYRLAQNYPNPFNPSTAISFEMPVAGQASLVVYDISGREVSQLVDGYLDAGVHEAEFGKDERSPLASGVYLYQLIVRSPVATPFVATRRMLLLK